MFVILNHKDLLEFFYSLDNVIEGIIMILFFIHFLYSVGSFMLIFVSIIVGIRNEIVGVDDGYWKIDVGIGTNEKELILVLGHRNAQQRKEIKETYQKLYNESLVDRLQSELSGDFRVCIMSFLLPLTIHF